MQQLLSVFKTGRYSSLRDQGGGIYNGRRIQQGATGFSLTMVDYITQKLQSVVIPKSRRGCHDSPLDNQEKEMFRTILMKCMWCARQAHPEIIGGCTLLSGRVNDCKIGDLVELGRVVKHLLEHKDQKLIIHGIYPSSIRLFVTADASPSGLKGENAQSGILIGLTDDHLDKGVHAKVSWVLWKSSKIDRKCSSSLAAEAYSLVQGCGLAEWAHQAISEFSNSEFVLSWARARFQDWQRGSIVDLNGVMLIKAELPEEARRHLLLTDAKSLFDAIKKDSGSRGDPRISLSTSEAREAMSMLGLKPRWAPHNAMPVDCLTKLWSKGHSAPLLESIKTGRFQLAAEAHELQSRKAEREAVGRNLRQKAKHDKSGE
eukprot:6490722-Amphidinium_carterae.1